MTHPLQKRAERLGLKLYCRADGTFILDNPLDKYPDVAEFQNASELTDHLNGLAEFQNASELTENTKGEPCDTDI